MKATEVASKYVFEKLGKGEKVDAVDFKKKTYVDISGLTINSLQALVARADSNADVKFYTITEESA